MKNTRICEKPRTKENFALSYTRSVIMGRREYIGVHRSTNCFVSPDLHIKNQERSTCTWKQGKTRDGALAAASIFSDAGNSCGHRRSLPAVFQLHQFGAVIVRRQTGVRPLLPLCLVGSVVRGGHVEQALHHLHGDVQPWDVLREYLAVLGAAALERGQSFPQLVPGRARQVPRDGGHDGWAPGVVDGVGGVRRGWRDGVLPTGS